MKRKSFHKYLEKCSDSHEPNEITRKALENTKSRKGLKKATMVKNKKTHWVCLPCVFVYKGDGCCPHVNKCDKCNKYNLFELGIFPDFIL